MNALLTVGQIKNNLADKNWKKLQEKDVVIRHIIDWKNRDKMNKLQTLLEYLTGKVPLFDAQKFGKHENLVILFRNLL